MSQRFIVQTVYRMNGKAKATGQPYDMKRIVALSDFEQVSNVTPEGEVLLNRQGAGFSPVEVVVSDAFFPRLLAFFSQQFELKRSPIVMDLETSVRARGRQSETVIVDFSDEFKKKNPSLNETVAA
jgi:hypothetical protein